MPIRATKEKTAKQISAVQEEIGKSHPLVKRFIEEYQKENARIQTLIAKNQVAHESEINKIHAEAVEKIRTSFNMHFNDVTPAPRDKKVV